jgi:hypothetical protein
MTKLKALSVLECREYVLETFGPDAPGRVKSAMSATARGQIYSEQLMASDWIELEAVVEHAVVLDAIMGTGDGTVCREMMREITARHHRGLYKAILSAPNPREALTRSSRLWPRFYDHGETFVEFPTPTSAIKRIVGCPDLPRRHDWLVMPYYEETIRQAGGRDVVSEHVQCVADGAECCLTRLRWTEGYDAFPE